MATETMSGPSLGHADTSSPPVEGSTAVLLVDDDAAVREAYSRILNKLGCVVETAASGVAALKVLRTRSFDLIVTDITMAEMSGTQFLRAIREQNLDVPVILMTGLPGHETTREAVDYSAFRCLTKPVDLRTFSETVRSAIHMHVVARLLAEHVPFADACRHIVHATCRGIDWDFATIWMPADAEHMQCVETWARPGHDVAAFEEATRTLKVEVARDFPRKGWTCDLPDWITGISADSTLPRASFALAAGFLSGFVVPLGADGEVFAVLEFFSRGQRAPDLALLELFAASGAQLGARVLRERAEQRATRAEKAQKTTKITLDAVMECAPAVIFVVDEHGTIQFTNRAFAPMKIEDVIGSDWLRYLPPEDAEQYRSRLHRIMTTGIAETYEATVIGPDGTALSFTSHIGPLRDNDRVVGAVVVAQDVPAAVVRPPATT